MEFFDPNVSVNLQVNPSGRYNAVKVLSNQDNNGMGSDSGPGTIALNLYGDLDMNGYNIINGGGETPDAVTSVIWRNTGAPAAPGVVVGDSSTLQDFLTENVNCNIVYCDSSSPGGVLQVDTLLALNNKVRLIGYILNTTLGAFIRFIGLGGILNAALIEDLNLVGQSNLAPLLVYDCTASDIEAGINRSFISSNTARPLIQIVGSNEVTLNLNATQITPNGVNDTVDIAASSTLILTCSGFGGFFAASALPNIFGGGGTVNITNTTMTMPLVGQTGATQNMDPLNSIQIAAVDNVGFINPATNTINAYFESVQDYIRKLANLQSSVLYYWSGNDDPAVPYFAGTAQTPNNGNALIYQLVLPSATSWIQPEIGNNLNFIRSPLAPGPLNGITILVEWQLDLQATGDTVISSALSVPGGAAIIQNEAETQAQEDVTTQFNAKVVVQNWVANTLSLQIISSQSVEIVILGCFARLTMLNY